MVFKFFYKTPDGFSDMWMNSDGEVLTGLWFDGSKDALKHVMDCEEKSLPVFEETIRWLDIYFNGGIPDFTPKYRINNLTEFRQDVINHMITIPYGKVITYGDIAKDLAEKRNIKKMSARAVGGAVGWNPLCIIIPCHRVIGSNHSLTGYSGGIENKISLLKLENHDMREFIIPCIGTAL